MKNTCKTQGFSLISNKIPIFSNDSLCISNFQFFWRNPQASKNDRPWSSGLAVPIRQVEKAEDWRISN